MTTKPTTEYVIDVEHSVACRSIDDRKALCLVRCVSQVQQAYFDEADGVSLIVEPDDRNWPDDDTLEPMRLACSSCGAERFVGKNGFGDIVALTPERCIRYSKVYGHLSTYDRKPCEYCGFTGRAS